MHPSTVPLSLLSIDEKANVRKTGRGSEPMFVASIEAKGIIEPLTVRINGKGYAVTNGGKRLSALQWMKDHGKAAAGVAVTDGFEVPVNVREEDDKNARDTSLMTNIIRAGMHPVDEFEAFAALRDDGMQEAEIAVRYGLKEKEVRQRLALGRISPVIREAWRADKVSAEQAMAYTLGPTHKAQEQFFKKYGDDRWRGNANNIRDAFAVKHRDVGKLVAFVGIDELRKAGVKVDEDLFGTDHRAADPKTVAAMAHDKLEAECARLIAAGWAWALTATDPVAEHSRSWGSLGWRDKKPNPDEKKRLDALRKITETNEDVFIDEMSPVDLEAQDEIDAIEGAIEERLYKPAERAKAGCIISISDRGRLEVRYGVLKPAEAKKEKAVEKEKERKKKGLPVGEPDLSGAVAHDLNVTLTRAAAEAVVSAPDLAVQFLLIGLLAVGYGGTSVKLRPEGLGARNLTRDMKAPAAIAAVLKMSPAERMTLLAEHIGAAFDFTSFNKDYRPLKNDPVAQFICNTIKPDALSKALQTAFDPGMYFPRIAAPLILKAIGEAVNEDEERRVSKLKKKEIVAFALANVPKTRWLPPELRTSHYDGPGAKIADKTARAKALGAAKTAEKKAAKPAKKAARAKRP